MTTENTELSPEAKALSAQGATEKNISDGQGNKGVSPAPKPEETKKPDPVVEPKKDEVKPEAKPEEKKVDPVKTVDATDPEVGVTKWVQLDDAAGAAVIELLAAANVTPLEGNAIFQKAVASGNLEDVDWVALEKKLSPGNFLLAKAGVEKYYNDAYAPIQATVNAGYDICGGEANWNLVREWAQKKESADPSFKKTVDEIRHGIAQNGTVAKLSIKELRSLYEADPKNKGLGTTKKLEADNITVASGAGLSAAEYKKEVEKLTKGGRYEPEPAKYDALRARRIAGKRARL